MIPVTDVVTGEAVLIFYLALLIIGPCLGSFASAITWRAPRGQSWISSDRQAARSCCPHCGGQLRWFDLIPLISWMAHLGRCRMCGHSLSWMYPALEIAAFLLSWAFLYMYGSSILFLGALSLLPFLLALVVISANGHKLPDQLLMIVGGITIVCISFHAYVSDRPAAYALDHSLGLAAMMVCGACLCWARQRIGKGAFSCVAQFKLLAIAGLWFGLTQSPVFMILAGFYGAVYGALSQKRAEGAPKMEHAFITSFLMTMVAGDAISRLFLN